MPIQCPVTGKVAWGLETIPAPDVLHAMSGQLVKRFTSRLILAALPLGCITGSIAMSPLEASRPADPLRFFEGRTEYISTMKLIAKKPYRSRTLGQGEIEPDGSLHLVQKVQDEGKPAHERRWHMRQVAPRRFAGTMSEARGPVTVDEVDGRYRFRFRMKGGVSVEQWLTPVSSSVARSRLTVRKLGLTVGRSEGSIRKL